MAEKKSSLALRLGVGMVSLIAYIVVPLMVFHDGAQWFSDSSSKMKFLCYVAFAPIGFSILVILAVNFAARRAEEPRVATLVTLVVMGLVTIFWSGIAEGACLGKVWVWRDMCEIRHAELSGDDADPLNLIVKCDDSSSPISARSPSPELSKLLLNFEHHPRLWCYRFANDPKKTTCYYPY